MELNDEACVAIALLHGAHFWRAERAGSWYVDDPRSETTDRINKVEKLQLKRTGTCIFFKSREEAARIYCEAYGLL